MTEKEYLSKLEEIKKKEEEKAKVEAEIKTLKEDLDKEIQNDLGDKDEKVLGSLTLLKVVKTTSKLDYSTIVKDAKASTVLVDYLKTGAKFTLSAAKAFEKVLNEKLGSASKFLVSSSTTSYDIKVEAPKVTLDEEEIEI